MNSDLNLEKYEASRKEHSQSRLNSNSIFAYNMGRNPVSAFNPSNILSNNVSNCQNLFVNQTQENFCTSGSQIQQNLNKIVKLPAINDEKSESDLDQSEDVNHFNTTFNYRVNKSINSSDCSVSNKSSNSSNISPSPVQSNSFINSDKNQFNYPYNKTVNKPYFLSLQDQNEFIRTSGSNEESMFLSPTTKFKNPLSLQNNIHPQKLHLHQNINKQFIFNQHNNHIILNSPPQGFYQSQIYVNKDGCPLGSKSSNNVNFNNLNSSNNLFDVNYFLENIFEFLKDQNGCRMVQQKLEEKSSDKNFIFNFYQKVQNKIVDIITHQYGNYVAQKYFEIIIGDKVLVCEFFERIREDLYLISVNTYGTRFFQRSLESLASVYYKLEIETVSNILKKLIEDHIFDLILDTNGNHIFQKLLILFPVDKNQFIYDGLSKFALPICKLKQGANILNKAFECASSGQLKQLVFEILRNFNNIIDDEYGNFIIQQIVFLKNTEFNFIIFNFIKSNIVPLSKKKFSSNVIDKCILLDDPVNENKLRNDIIDYLIENKLIGELICDQFGNYVIQKALQVSDGLRFVAIIHEIKPYVKRLKQTANGRKIFENLLKNYGKYVYCSYDGRRSSHYFKSSTTQNKLDK